MKTVFKHCIRPAIEPLLFLLIAAFVAVATDSASATLTSSLSVDLIPVTGTNVIISGSIVDVDAVGATLSVQLWADVWCSDYTTSGTFGVAGAGGSILVGDWTGNNANGTFAMYGSSSFVADGDWKPSNTQIGALQDLNGDGALDLGGRTTATSSSTQFLEARCDVSNIAFSYCVNGIVHSYCLSNQLPWLVQGTDWRVNPLQPNSLQFFLGTLTWTDTSLGSDVSDPRIMQWVFPKFANLAANVMGMWDDNGVYHDNYTGSATGQVQNTGQEILIYETPEPGTWALLTGGIALLGLGRRLRRDHARLKS